MICRDTEEGLQLFLSRRHHVQVSILTSGASEYEVLAAIVGRRNGSRWVGQGSL